MRYFHLIILFQIPFFLMGNSASGQEFSKITPLHEFFRIYSDSTLVLQYTSSVVHRPEYFILSKKADTISIYTYKINKNIDGRLLLPRDIALKLHQRNTLEIFKVPVDVNFYFQPRYLDANILRKFWVLATKLQPWQLTDDSLDGIGCPKPVANKEILYDGGGIALDLITKGGIKQLYFYAPGYYERVCSGRKSRQVILEITKLFEQHF